MFLYMFLVVAAFLMGAYLKPDTFPSFWDTVEDIRYYFYCRRRAKRYEELSKQVKREESANG